eukprot:m.403782 g.403782  ORF g.403782 m.403782 type:complete len:126 (-) comp28415_c1_seq1:295-672(-)
MPPTLPPPPPLLPPLSIRPMSGRGLDVCVAPPGTTLGAAAVLGGVGLGGEPGDIASRYEPVRTTPSPPSAAMVPGTGVRSAFGVSVCAPVVDTNPHARYWGLKLSGFSFHFREAPNNLSMAVMGH